MVKAALTGRHPPARRKKRSTGTVPIILGLIFLILAILSRVDHPLVKEVRQQAIDLTAPAAGVLAQPIQWISGSFDIASAIWNAHVENADLKRDLADYEAGKANSDAAFVEGERLRRLHKLSIADVTEVATVRVVGTGGGPFVRAVLVSGGDNAGIKKGMPVLDQHGVTGRVFEAGRWSARVLLLTDLNSRIPVRIERTGVNAIAAGNNDAELRLIFLPPESDVTVGDRIVTSGHGGAFPADIPVGEVLSVDKGVIRLRHVAALDRLDYLRILSLPRIDASGVAERAAEPERDMAVDGKIDPAGPGQ